MEKWQEEQVKYRIAAGEKPEDVYFDIFMSRWISEVEFNDLMLKKMSQTDLDVYMFYNNIRPDLPVDNVSPAMKREVGAAFVEALAKEPVFEGECVYGYRFAIVGDKDMEDTFQSVRQSELYGQWEKELDILGVKCKIGISYGD